MDHRLQLEQDEDQLSNCSCSSKSNGSDSPKFEVENPIKKRPSIVHEENEVDLVPNASSL